MNQESKRYGLLLGAGIYQYENLKNLSGTAKDLRSMKAALTGGLKFDPENIRILGEDGIVTARSFAMALLEFKKLLKEEDTFVLYFSGHGTHKGLCFIDEIVNLRSIAHFVEELPAGQKVIILDCCYSGEADLTRDGLSVFEYGITRFSGRGTAVMASCAKDERSWLSEMGDSSLYTQVVSAALESRHIRSHLRKGCISLNDVNDEVRYLMRIWNDSHPDRQQHPIYRENYTGDIMFKVEEYHPYTMQKITAETEDYFLKSVKPFSTGKLKRLAAFVILKTADDTVLPTITKEIVSQFKNSDVYASAQSEKQFKGRSADAIWCYFGYDEDDIQKINHFAYTIWAGSEDLKKIYYRERRNAEIVDGIYVYWNASYEMVKDLQKTTQPEEDILEGYRFLERLLIAKAEDFIKAYEEVENEIVSIDHLKEQYGDWISDVKHAFFRLSEEEPVPNNWHDWSEAVQELAGWVVDLAIILEKKEKQSLSDEKWLIKNAVSRYRQAMENLKGVEINSISYP